MAPVDEANEFIADVLQVRQMLPLVVETTEFGPVTIALAASLPVGERPEFDQRLLEAERLRARAPFCRAVWSAVGTGTDQVVVRLDVVSFAPDADLRSLVEQGLIFDVTGPGPMLWAAAVSKALMLLREPTFSDGIKDIERDQKPVGLYLTNIAGGEVLRSALEQAGVTNENDYKGLWGEHGLLSSDTR